MSSPSETLQEECELCTLSLCSVKRGLLDGTSAKPEEFPDSFLAYVLIPGRTGAFPEVYPICVPFPLP